MDAVCQKRLKASNVFQWSPDFALSGAEKCVAACTLDIVSTRDLRSSVIDGGRFDRDEHGCIAVWLFFSYVVRKVISALFALDTSGCPEVSETVVIRL